MRGNLFVLLTGILFTCLQSCDQWDSSGYSARSHGDAIAQEGSSVTMSPVTAADYGGTPPVLSILCPDAGEQVKAEDIRTPVAALLAEADDIRNNAVTGLANKVDRDGDLGMTNDFAISGTLSISGSPTDVALSVTAASGETAVEILGDTNIPALSITSPAGVAIAAFGGGANASIAMQGGLTGPGFTAQSGTTSLATAPTEAGRAAGYLRITAPNPNAGVDPGATGTIFSGSVARARGRLYLGGAPPFSFIGAKPLNLVALVAVVGAGTTRVTMVRPMADLNYEVQLSIHGAVGYAVSETNIAGRTTTQFEFTVFSTTTATPGVGPAEYVDVAVFGEQ